MDADKILAGDDDFGEWVLIDLSHQCPVWRYQVQDPLSCCVDAAGRLWFLDREGADTHLLSSSIPDTAAKESLKGIGPGTTSLVDNGDVVELRSRIEYEAVTEEEARRLAATLLLQSGIRVAEQAKTDPYFEVFFEDNHPNDGFRFGLILVKDGEKVWRAHLDLAYAKTFQGKNDASNLRKLVVPNAIGRLKKNLTTTVLGTSQPRDR